MFRLANRSFYFKHFFGSVQVKESPSKLKQVNQMTDRASLLWEPTTTATLPDDPSFNTIRATKVVGASTIASHLDKTVTMVCDGHMSCEGTFWANRVRAQTRTTTCDRNAKVKPQKKTHFLKGVRQLNIYQYHYKGDDENDTTLGVMAQELMPVFPEIVVPATIPGQYMSIKSDGVPAIALGAIKELDATQQFILDSQKQIHKKNEELERDVRVQAERLREQDDRLRAQSDLMRMQADRLRMMEEQFMKLKYTINST